MEDLKSGIDKNSRESLPLQLSRILLQRIESGYYAPGGRIDSVRTIASAFGVSTVSVQNALKLLKEEGAVLSVPGSGILVNEDFVKSKATTDIAFVFPEAVISPEILNSEDWIINSEIHLGLLRGAEIYGARIHFIHADEAFSPANYNRVLHEIRQNDAALFVGGQLENIQRELAATMPVIDIISEYDRVPDGVIQVSFRSREAIRTIVRHAVECGCRTAGIISFHDLNSARPRQSLHAIRCQTKVFFEACAEAGLATSPEFNWELNSSQRCDLALRDLLQKSRPDFIFCNYSFLVKELYEACMDCGLRIGRDVLIMAKAAGLSLQGLIPELTYMKPPAFETAVDIVNYACRLTRGTIDPADLNLRKNKYQLIKGKST
ncbi:MAG: GntR family transcriptional regulator, partial [Lentisphaeria bacterium]|nr:GntR family transcriptional regulator [Lentisphaeria bacterium]